MDFVGKMETPDKYTVVVNMTSWCADWWYRMGWGYYDAIQAPEQEKASGGPNRWENATGTGPFMITEYKDGHSQTYTKNPKYWDSEINGGKKYQLPFVDKVQKMIIKDEQTRLASFRSGKLDKGNAELHTYPFPPSFKDVYTPLDKLPPLSRELFTYNPEKAKKLLAEAGYPNGFTFKAQIANNFPVQLDLAAMVVAYLDKIGVKLELDPMDYSSWLGRMMKKNHSEGIFFNNDHGGPYSGIRKNFLTGQAWNPHMMADPWIIQNASSRSFLSAGLQPPYGRG
jgi:ABC-type transport system substrate-binding protein